MIDPSGMLAIYANQFGGNGPDGGYARMESNRRWREMYTPPPPSLEDQNAVMAMKAEARISVMDDLMSSAFMIIPDYPVQRTLFTTPDTRGGAKGVVGDPVHTLEKRLEDAEEKVAEGLCDESVPELLKQEIEVSTGEDIDGDGEVSGSVEDGSSPAVPQSNTNSSTGEANVYIETDGIGHAYIEVNNVVFSYGRYNGSYSPSSGRFGPYGDGVLLKKEGADAKNFVKERSEKYPTNSYSVKVNASKVYSYLNTLYSNGSTVVDKNGNVGPGRVIDTYTLIGPGGNNCTTLVSRALQEGGMSIGTYQSPASLNLFFINSNAINQGYNPGLWGPKQ